MREQEVSLERTLETPKLPLIQPSSTLCPNTGSTMLKNHITNSVESNPSPLDPFDRKNDNSDLNSIVNATRVNFAKSGIRF